MSKSFQKENKSFDIVYNVKILKEKHLGSFQEMQRKKSGKI